MALKDHSLDEKIVKAAVDEFMEFGFQKASIRKIADRAGVTAGAVYTRDNSKDALFCSLVDNFLSAVKNQSEPLCKIFSYCCRILSNRSFQPASRKVSTVFIQETAFSLL